MANIIGNITKHAFCRFTALLSVLPLLLLSQSCVEERPKVLENTVLSLEPLRLELSAAKVDFSTPADSRQTVQVRSANMDWMFTDIPEWITVTPASGSGDTEVSIEVSENTRAVNRVGVLTFGSKGSIWNYSMGFSVSQYRAPYSISLPVDSVQIDGGGGTKTVLVNTNTDTWTIIIPESMKKWCSALKTEDGIVVTATANTGNAPRSGKIELHTDDVSAFLSVTQRPAGVNTTTDRVDFPVAGGIETIPINIEASWTIETTYSWIDIKTKSGSAGFVNIIMEALPNFSSTSRDGFIYIVLSDDNKIEIPVHQDCVEFSVDRSSISVPSGGSTERLGISSNVSWVIPDSMNTLGWLSVDPMSGNGNMQLLIKVNANRSLDDRSAILPIYIVSNDADTYLERIDVEIVQAGRLFGADSAAIYFSDKAGSTYFNIRSDGYWFVSTPDSWITLYPDEGEESGTVKVSVTENKDSIMRTGTIIVRTQGQRDTIPVYQAGRYINVSSDVMVFNSGKDSTELNLTTNGHWTASASDAWIELSAAEGNGDCSIMITALDNPSSISREAEVTVIRDDMTPVKISVSQKGRYLTVTTSLIEFFQEGGTSEPIIVQTDGNYDITTGADWITVNKETESQFTITVTENTDPESRTERVLLYLTDLVSDTLMHVITIIQQCDIYAPTGHEGSYGYVDLGLSVNWATFNVGATAPEEYGDYFAWGETEPKDDYSWSSYKWCEGSENTLTKYCDNSEYGFNGFTDDKSILDPEDDAACVNWGGEWRMPTSYEYMELISNCSWTYTTLKGVNGYMITSKIKGFENRSIFMPATMRYEDRLYNFGYFGWALYQSSDIVTSYPDYQVGFYFQSDAKYIGSGTVRFDGYTVRPVCKSETYNPEKVTSLSIGLNERGMTVGDSVKVYARPTNSLFYYIESDIHWFTSDDHVAVVSSEGVINAVGVGTCTITAVVDDIQSFCTVTVTAPLSEASGYENGYGYVDLGLSVKWATLNVGADSPKDYGDYFAWGETEPYYESGYAQSYSPVWKSGKSDGYTWSNYKFYEGGESDENVQFSKYNTKSSSGIVDNNITLDPEDDVAHVLWGGGWRMPTKAEQDELLNNCTWVWMTENGFIGYKVVSNVEGYEGRSIFLPAADSRSTTGIGAVGIYGFYWSSSLGMDTPYSYWAYDLRFAHPDIYDNLGNYSRSRFNGFTIRPVLSSVKYIPLLETVLSIELNHSDYSMAVGDSTQMLAVPKNDNDDDVMVDVVWSSSDDAVAEVTHDGVVHAIGVGSCVIAALVGDIQSICTVTVSKPNVTPEYVDLGLRVKWATFNVGASAPEEYGDYFAWGETEPYYKPGFAQSYESEWKSYTSEGYSWRSYRYSMDYYGFTKYCTDNDYFDNNFIDGKVVLDSEDDVAYVNWGGGWRMPTETELDELVTNCTWTWVMRNGVNGYEVSSNKSGYEGHSIFLPAAGYRHELHLQRLGLEGCYWSRSLRKDYPFYALSLDFNLEEEDVYDGRDGERYNGQSVRPVCLYYDSEIKGIEMDWNDLVLVVGQSFVLRAFAHKDDIDYFNLSVSDWSSSDESVATVSDGVITAVGEGICTITASLGSHTAICIVTVKDKNSITPEYVDLGLSVKWATFNIGAYVPEDPGDYFAWGEIEPKSDYSWTSYRWCEGSENTLIKYCDTNEYGFAGFTDDKSILDSEDDAAHVNWGGEWRMPTIAEQDELLESCTWIWTTRNGVKGYKITSNKKGYTDRSIFLPAAGGRRDSNLYNVDNDGSYWSSSLSTNSPYCAWFLGLHSGNHFTINYPRCEGHPIRPVCP